MRKENNELQLLNKHWSIHRINVEKTETLHMQVLKIQQTYNPIISLSFPTVLHNFITSS